MSGKPWTDEELNTLHQLFPHHPTKHCADVLGMTLGQVNNKAYALGLKKSAEYMEREKPGQLDGTQGSSNRFKKGQAAWNKGKSYTVGGRSGETRFKNGHTPPNWRPVGTERVTKDGIRQRKVSDTGCKQNDWQAVHRLLWEEHYGPVPKGYIVVFKNGIRKDIWIENLELITRAENARRNSIHRYPPEVKSAMRAVGKLKRAIKKHEETSA